MSLDALIVGQGLAGTSLAWALLARGADILIVDRERGSGASTVAAGLVTPVTGRALSTPKNFLADRALAAAHYRAVERATGSSLWHERSALRLFASPADARRKRRREAALGAMLAPARPAPGAGFAPYADAALMPAAARLDVARYLDASRMAFTQRGCYAQQDVDTTGFEFSKDRVSVPGVARRTRFVVLCGGCDDADGAWIDRGMICPAKGEIITVRIDGLGERRTTHCAGQWLLPTGSPGQFRFGATYDHDDTTAEPTSGARERLCARLREIVHADIEVVSQIAGLRPVGANRQSVVGAHPARPRVVVFNGLGSRGVLWAPRIADELAAALCSAQATTQSLPRLPI